MLTENCGFWLTKAEIRAVQAHAKAQGLTVSDYLRLSAVRPLMEAQQAQVGLQDGPNEAA
jgi:hypothetical protein